MKIGLALSGGTLRGAAHAGVLEVLTQAGIRPDVIAGSSAGSVVAGLYAHGLPPKTISRLAGGLQGRELIDWTTSVGDLLWTAVRLPFYWLGLSKDLSKMIPIGFVRGNKFEEHLNRMLRLSPAHEPIPLLVTAVDLYSAESVVYTDSSLVPPADSRYEPPGTVFLPITDRAAAIRASCSMPGVFAPRELDGRTLIDGAIRTTIPAELLFQAGCDKVIAVDLLHAELSQVRVHTFFDVFLRSWDIMANDITALQLRDENIFYIRPAIQGVGWTSFERIEYCIEQGRQAARDALPAIRSYLTKKPPRL
ncbi:patatin-like phospholipase family protein [Tumebacillus sp. DT12]|uniref:Patatin-like phospholipase family protein n=1 Tax=Tumebacillus lacus TaxID=2995335 RepID=A0ABT3X029_9BACL|nr:patatin-like phospholipase family protein [Tumebacillus lacus]MCX7568900.1 patatin-like phospholipase family protein [Tumebacillus lacus]